MSVPSHNIQSSGNLGLAPKPYCGPVKSIARSGVMGPRLWFFPAGLLSENPPGMTVLIPRVIPSLAYALPCGLEMTMHTPGRAPRVSLGTEPDQPLAESRWLSGRRLGKQPRPSKG